MRPLQLILCVSCFTGLVACSKEPPALTTPSGEQPSYAEQYPAQLTQLRQRFAQDEAKVQAALPQLEPASQKLGNANPETVEQLFDLADSTGRSGSYANEAQTEETVSRFWEEEKQPLHQKIGGAVSYTAKQKECAAGDDLAGAAAGGADRAVEKQLEERQQRIGEIHRFVEDHEDELGKANQDAAEKQATALAQVSHLTYVRLELYRRELAAALNESSSVRSTLDRIQKESDATLADPKASKSKRAMAEKRKASAAAAITSLQAEEDLAKQALADMEQREKKVQQDYEQAMKGLKASLEQRAKK